MTEGQEQPEAEGPLDMQQLQQQVAQNEYETTVASVNALQSKIVMAFIEVGYITPEDGQDGTIIKKSHEAFELAAGVYEAGVHYSKEQNARLLFLAEKSLELRLGCKVSLQKR